MWELGLGVAESLSPVSTFTTMEQWAAWGPEMGCGGPGCERGSLCLFVGSWANVWTSLWFGSFLASPRGTTVASEFEVLSSVAHAGGERSKGNQSRLSEDSGVGEMRRLSCFQAAASDHLLPHAGIYTPQLEADVCRTSWVALHDGDITGRDPVRGGLTMGGKRRASWFRTSQTLPLSG